MKKKEQGDLVACDTETLPLTPCFSWVYHSRIQRKTVLTVYPRLHTHRCRNTEGIWRLPASSRSKDQTLPIGNLTEFDLMKGGKICHRLTLSHPASALRPLASAFPALRPNPT